MVNQESTADAKEDFYKLKKSLIELEEMIKLKNNKINSQTESAKRIMQSLVMLFEESKKDLALKCIPICK